MIRHFAPSFGLIALQVLTAQHETVLHIDLTLLFNQSFWSKMIRWKYSAEVRHWFESISIFITNHLQPIGRAKSAIAVKWINAGRALQMSNTDLIYINLCCGEPRMGEFTSNSKGIDFDFHYFEFGWSVGVFDFQSWKMNKTKYKAHFTRIILN